MSESQNGARAPISTELAQIGARAPISAEPMTRAELALADAFNVDVTAPRADRLAVAVEKTNQALYLIVQAGLHYLSVKAECSHGEFEQLLAEAGVASRRAREAMALAKGLAVMPEDARVQLLAVGKRKALAIASADAEVVEALLEEGVERIDAMTVRQLQDEIRALKGQVANEEAIRQTAEARAETLQKRLAQHENRTRGDKLPVAIADLRAELSALTRKAQLAVESFGEMGVDLLNLNGASSAYVDGTLRLGVAALAHLRLLIDGQLKRWVEALPEGDEPGAALVNVPATGYLTEQEIDEAARRWSQLAQVHEYEKKLREYEREQAKPKGKGRPMAKPEAPAGA